MMAGNVVQVPDWDIQMPDGQVAKVGSIVQVSNCDIHKSEYDVEEPLELIVVVN